MTRNTWADFGIEVHGKVSGEVKTTCPQCSASRKKHTYPCLNVNLDKGAWHCWHCDWSGGLGTGEEHRPYRPPLPRVYKKPVYHPSGLPTDIIEWFARRGIPEPVLTRRQIGFGLVYMPQVEDEVEAIQFPYLRSGETVNVKYRDREKHFRMAAGAERILYGLDDLTGETLLLCEGEMDALSLEVAGFPSVVSVPDGAPAVGTKNYASKFEFLASADTALMSFTRIVLAVDADGPGQKLAEELARRLGPERCWLVTWPSECKDANDVLVRQGAAALRTCIETSQPWPISGIVTGDMLSSAIDYLYDHGLDHGLSPGWPSVAAHYRVRPGEMTIVTGIPSHGKSQWVTALMVNLAQAHGWRSAIFSAEHHPPEEYAARIFELYTGKPFDKDKLHRMSRETMEGAKAWFTEHFSILMPEDEAPTVPHMLRLARAQVTRQGIQGLLLDPWNELEHNRSAAVTETEYVSQALSQIRRFARAHKVHVWVVAHPTKLKKAESGDYKGLYPPPTPYDISGSAHWRNKADNCITIWRDVEATDNRVEVHIQKIRFREAGSPGKVDLLYERTCGRYREEDAATADTRYERDLPPVPVPPPPVPPLFAAASPHGTNGHAASVPFDESQDVNPDEEEQDMEEFTP